ncbi:unnamed protein product [Lactuca saligna]|uniref:Uncharacterized protein n=1 Tax=Lactuca saligna TaxID=75948 RepID=A0AA35Y2F6_LACSI|nr:unnamed protein product [Lactuca saligna]
MVAISLYKGKLHRSPDVPHQWLVPTPKISAKDFKNLLQRRSRALSRLEATTTNPNPNPNENSVDDATSDDREPPESDGPAVDDVSKHEEASKVNGDKTFDDELVKSNHADQQKESKVGDEDETLVIPGEQLVAVDDAKAVVDVPENASNAVDDLQDEGKTDAQHQLEPLKNVTLSDIEKRKKEVEEKLQILNARKHNLVQVLKQILSAEEELRRRSNVQQGTTTGHQSISLQVDVGNDSGSMSRQVTPRPASEVNCNGDTEGDDAQNQNQNQNQHSRSLPRMSSVSPSSDSLHRRTPFAMASNPSRTTSGVVTSSPSRFAPTSQQANGGTSVFRDARLPSPWN